MPVITENMEKISAIIIVFKKLFLNCSAIITGKTISADINKTPTIGIESDITRADKIIITKFTSFVFTPLTLADSSSNET